MHLEVYVANMNMEYGVWLQSINNRSFSSVSVFPAQTKMVVKKWWSSNNELSNIDLETNARCSRVSEEWNASYLFAMHPAVLQSFTYMVCDVGLESKQSNYSCIYISSFHYTLPRSKRVKTLNIHGVLYQMDFIYRDKLLSTCMQHKSQERAHWCTHTYVYMCVYEGTKRFSP